MYEKESKDKLYRNDLYRVVNFPLDPSGFMVCPNGRRFFFLRTAPGKVNQYGRTEEYYQCENCGGCTQRELCHKSKGNRIARESRELTAIHEEILRNLNCMQGALLRMNRSIEAEGIYDSKKWNPGYTRFRRWEMDNVIFEDGLICCSINLHKYHIIKIAMTEAA